MLYSIQFLHQITTGSVRGVLGVMLYSIQFLHQITTWFCSPCFRFRLYSIQFLHQITTPGVSGFSLTSLYSIQFLHQITTRDLNERLLQSCIVSNFYIKSQPQVLHLLIIRVLHPYVPRKKRCSANWGSRFDAVFPFCKTNISKKFQLLRYFGTGAFDLAPEIQNFAVLFVRYAQDARHSGRRHRFADPPDMDLHIFLGDAVPDVDRVLHHREAVLFQCLAKLGRVAPFGFGMGRQVEKYE